MKDRTRRYGIVDAHIMQDNTLTIEARALYAILASYSKADTRECAPSVKTLVKVSGISKDRFYKHMGQLVERGIVEKLALTRKNAITRID